MENKDKERIIHLRKLLTIHSYIYYVLDDSIMCDAEWDHLARELAELQKLKGIDVGFYDEIFSDFNGNTGMHLPREEWVRKEALNLLKN